MSRDIPKNHIKSRARVRDQGEVFTQDREVKNILNLTDATHNIFWRFLEPACGNGNFIVEIVRQRLAKIKSTPNYRPSEKREYAIVKMLSTIYGVDIAADNIVECKKRVLDEVFKFVPKKSSSTFLLALQNIIDTNIQTGDMLNGKSDIYFIDYLLTGREYISMCLVKRSVFALTDLEAGKAQPIESYPLTKLDEITVIDLTKYRSKMPNHAHTGKNQTTLFDKELMND